MRTILSLIVAAFVLSGTMVWAGMGVDNDSDIIKLVNNSDFELSIDDKVDLNGEIVPGGWEQEPHRTIQFQFMSENTSLLYIEISIPGGDGNKESIFKKQIAPHTAQKSFDITVNQDKTVTCSEQ